MLKIKVLTEKTGSGYKDQFVRYLTKTLESSNLIKLLPGSGVKNLPSADYIVTNMTPEQFKQKYGVALDPNRTIYVYVSDAASILSSARFGARMIWCPLELTNKSQYNLESLHRRRHLKVFSDLMKQSIVGQVPAPIAPASIHSVIPQFHHFLPRPMPKVPALASRHRDLMFFGKVEYKGNHQDGIDLHRQLCVTKIRELAAKLNLSQETKFGKIAFKDYCSKLAGSRIMVSPFGYGEWSIKTYEALAYGCVPIVALGDFRVETSPPIYKALPHCKMDYSDLEQVVTSILSNLDHWQKVVDQLRVSMYNSAKVRSYNTKKLEVLLRKLTPKS